MSLSKRWSTYVIVEQLVEGRGGMNALSGRVGGQLGVSYRIMVGTGVQLGWGQEEVWGSWDGVWGYET